MSILQYIKQWIEPEIPKSTLELFFSEFTRISKLTFRCILENDMVLPKWVELILFSIYLFVYICFVFSLYNGLCEWTCPPMEAVRQKAAQSKTAVQNIVNIILTLRNYSANSIKPEEYDEIYEHRVEMMELIARDSCDSVNSEGHQSSETALDTKQILSKEMLDNENFHDISDNSVSKDYIGQPASNENFNKHMNLVGDADNTLVTGDNADYPSDHLLYSNKLKNDFSKQNPYCIYHDSHCSRHFSNRLPPVESFAALENECTTISEENQSDSLRKCHPLEDYVICSECFSQCCAIHDAVKPEKTNGIANKEHVSRLTEFLQSERARQRQNKSLTGRENGELESFNATISPTVFELNTNEHNPESTSKQSSVHSISTVSTVMSSKSSKPVIPATGFANVQNPKSQQSLSHISSITTTIASYTREQEKNPSKPHNYDHKSKSSDSTARRYLHSIGYKIDDNRNSSMSAELRMPGSDIFIAPKGTRSTMLRQRSTVAKFEEKKKALNDQRLGEKYLIDHRRMYPNVASRIPSPSPTKQSATSTQDSTGVSFIVGNESNAVVEPLHIRSSLKKSPSPTKSGRSVTFSDIECTQTYY